MSHVIKIWRNLKLTLVFYKSCVLYMIKFLWWGVAIYILFKIKSFGAINSCLRIEHHGWCYSPTWLDPTHATHQPDLIKDMLLTNQIWSKQWNSRVKPTSFQVRLESRVFILDGLIHQGYSLSYYLLIAGRRMLRLVLFPGKIPVCEKQTASFRY